MNTPTVRLVVSTMGKDHSAATLDSPSLDRLTDALSDLYARLGCEASSRETKAVLNRSGSDVDFHSEDPDASPEQVAAELWDKLGRFLR